MTPAQGIAAPLTHVAALHLAPGAIVLVGGLLAVKLLVLKSWHHHRKGRKTAESKQSELEQQLKDLQGQYDSLHTQQQNSAAKTQPPPAAPSATTPAASGKQALFEQLIKENIALREAL
ncbi:hypothetical protein VSS37_09955 [Candidatus Thiothrix sp. Deng01]|uniref:Uncharacterized protein n=1 Tax=Candidatus Thiothrix phosphatis TaxID=3112415 RepID=A0ABU6CWU8_9GAMM|nr:hypothetical protein [Candidatus Thiothrix sp. Deng01]MEB4591301.1 hypothetical protein [Candidatus Thiothrix sp. Deng01]